MKERPTLVPPEIGAQHTWFFVRYPDGSVTPRVRIEHGDLAKLNASKNGCRGRRLAQTRA